jgi:hypothetical protein
LSQKQKISGTKSLKEEIMEKIFDTLDDKHKTHDEILYGSFVQKSAPAAVKQGPISLVSLAPKTPE